ncbi:AAA family ATPase [Streptomyces sp. NPDC004779]
MLHACTRTGVEARRIGRGRLIGRETEWARAAAALGAARSGRGGALFVTGEPGAGRTRFTEEAVAAATAAGMLTARGRAGTVGAAVPYRPLAEVLLTLDRQTPRSPEGRSHDGVVARLLSGATVAPLAVAEAILQRLAPRAPHDTLRAAGRGVLGGGPVDAPRAAGRGVLHGGPVDASRAAGRGASAGGPSDGPLPDAAGHPGTLLVLDDLHHADQGTLAAVEYLLDHLGRVPVLLLLTLGPGGPSGAAAALLADRARRRGAATVLGLRPLGRSGVRRLLADGLGVEPAALGRDLVDRMMTAAAGLPFVVRETAHDLAARSAAAGRPGRVPEADEVRVPAVVADRVRRLAAPLGPLGAEFLGTAALFGHRFPVPVVRHALGRRGDADEELSGVLRAAVDACLIAPDEEGGAEPGWYAFRYGLAAEAVLAGLGSYERALRARRAARSLAALHPGLPGEWRARAAALHVHAGETGEAVDAFRAAARRAVAEGAVDRALALLDLARGSAGPGADPELRAGVLEELLDTVARTARFDRLPGLVAEVEALGGHGVPGPRRSGLHAGLAGIAALRGRPEEALRHLDVARWLLGASPSDAHAAPVDLAAARLAHDRPVRERHGCAAELARRAEAAARRAGLPAVACDAALLLGELAGHDDPATAARHFEEARALAEAHRLPLPRLTAEVRLARLAAARDGRSARVEQARREALRTGAAPLAHQAGVDLALDHVRRGAYEAAGERIRADLADAARLGLGRALALSRLAEAVCHAHQGRRAPMEETLDRLEPLLPATPGVRAMAYGLARGVCALLEERPDEARDAFVAALAYDAEAPAPGDFGRHGPLALLGVVGDSHGPGGQPPAEPPAPTAAGSRWDAVFTGLARAVLLGRAGRPAEATAAASAALTAAEPYPPARHLGVRLVARAAYEDGWGDPAGWLCEAEEYFHAAGLTAVSGACRALLRGMGAPVRQRRTGSERVPSELRRQGITVREFEVARLLAERIGNKDIAGRLHISPRTVEKHVASLLQKTGHPNRASFATAARDLMAGAARG